MPFLQPTMELQFQPCSSKKPTRSTKNKFVGVRQRPSGKFVAEIKNTTQKIRMWLGTFDTAEEAAFAYDEAACLLRGSNARTNFFNSMPCNPTLSLKIRNLLNHKRSLNNKSNPPFSTNNNQPPTAQTHKNATCQDADSYKPDLSSFIGMHHHTNQQLASDSTSIYDEALSDFNQMKVERQIAASLYAMNGMREYWETINDCSESDAFWDNQLLCQMFCTS